MLTTEQIEEKKEKYNQSGLDLATEREKTRLAYKEADSKTQLKRLCVNCFLFSRIEINEVEKLARRNLAVSMLEDMGFFDEENLNLIFNFFFELPLVGATEKKEKEI